MNAAHAFFLSRHRGPCRQRGFSLLVVLILLMLVLVLVLSGLMVANMNESIVGNQADTQRTYSAAQALLDTAQRDIRLNGRYCGVSQTGGSSTVPFGQAGLNFYFAPQTPATETVAQPPAPPVWPGAGVACTLRFPRDLGDYQQMLYGAKPGLNNCGAKGTPFGGVCISQGPTDPQFASNTVDDGNAGTEQWDNGKPDTGAAYGDFIPVAVDGGAAVAYGGSATAGSGANGTSAVALNIQGRYWVEVFQFAVMSGALGTANSGPVPDTTYPFVFRITAMARGLKPGTVSVLRSYYVPYPLTN